MYIGEILAYIILSLIFVTIFCGLFMIIKNYNTLKQYQKINNAIYEYRMSCIRKNISPNVDYDDEKNYNETLFRICDWGYKNILPPEKYEIIKEFIKINPNNRATHIIGHAEGSETKTNNCSHTEGFEFCTVERKKEKKYE